MGGKARGEGVWPAHVKHPVLGLQEVNSKGPASRREVDPVVSPEIAV